MLSGASGFSISAFQDFASRPTLKPLDRERERTQSTILARTNVHEDDGRAAIGRNPLGNEFLQFEIERQDHAPSGPASVRSSLL